LNAGVLFVIDELGKASSTEAVITGLDGHWDRHDFVAEGTSDLVLDGFGEVVGYLLLLLLLLFLGLIRRLFFHFLLLL
jgi:hypothetical protein